MTTVITCQAVMTIVRALITNAMKIGAIFCLGLFPNDSITGCFRTAPPLRWSHLFEDVLFNVLQGSKNFSRLQLCSLMLCPPWRGHRHIAGIFTFPSMFVINVMSYYLFYWKFSRALYDSCWKSLGCGKEGTNWEIEKES